MLNDTFVLHEAGCDKVACLCQNRIRKVDKLKYLGVIVDQCLRWDAHCDYLNSRLRKILFFIKQLSNYLTNKQKYSVYYALVQSGLLYGVLAWGSTFSTYIYSVQVLQNRILKILFHFNRLFSSELLYENLKIFNIRQLLFYKLTIFLFKTRGSLTNVCLYDTRHRVGERVDLPKCNTSHFRRHASNLLPKVNNVVPCEIKSESRLKDYKRKIKEFMSQNRDVIYSLDL